MKRLLILLVAIALAVVVLPAGTAVGAPPVNVTFEVETFGSPDFPASGDFTASGPAVRQGLMCPTGTTVDLGGQFSGFNPSQRGFNIQLVKEFDCDDETGTFVLKLEVRVKADGSTRFSWLGVEGTGEYEYLVFAHGRGVGIPCEDQPKFPAFCIEDFFTGQVKEFTGAAG